MPLFLTQIASASSNSSASATITEPSVNNTETLLLAANPTRKGFILENRSGASIYINYGDTVSMSNFSFRLPTGAYYESPPGFNYTGELNAIAGSGTNQIKVTEFVE